MKTNRYKIVKLGECEEEYFIDTKQEIIDYDDYVEIGTEATMSNKQVLNILNESERWNDHFCKDNQEDTFLNWEDVCEKLNEQQSIIEKQKGIIKSQDAEISRQYNLCLAMSGILREEFGVYDVFDRTKDKNIKKEDD